MDWNECCRLRRAKSIAPDPNLQHSLRELSESTLHAMGSITLTETSASPKVSLAYDALREVLEALANRRGHKLYNHECYTAFLKEVLHESESGDEFDSFRKVRNAINYYGKRVSAAEAEALLKRILALRVHCLRQLE